MIVIDMTDTLPSERRQALDEENARIRAQVAHAVFQSKLEIERRRQARERKEKLRRYWLQRTSWFGWGAALGFTLAMLIFGGTP